MAESEYCTFCRYFPTWAGPLLPHLSLYQVLQETCLVPSEWQRLSRNSRHLDPLGCDDGVLTIGQTQYRIQAAIAIGLKGS
jgi:hypothetical protein